MALAALLAASLSLVAPAPAPAAGAGPGSYTSTDVGFNGEIEDAARMAAYVPGASPLVRVNLNWASIQRERGAEPSWETLDHAVEQAEENGLRVLLLLAYAPDWANGHHVDEDGDGTRDDEASIQTWLPTDDAAWASIIDRTVRRYEGRVFAYEVWNEPNLPRFGKYEGGPADAMVRYWELTAIAHDTIHAVCAGCTVVAGPSAHLRDAGRTSSEWLEWAYRNGRAGTFDAVASHPYPRIDAAPGVSDCDGGTINGFGPPDEQAGCGELARVHRVMARYGDTGTKIWATEWGYPLANYGTQGIAAHVPRYVQSVEMWRALPYAGPLFLYRFRDCGFGPADCNWGISSRDHTPREPVFTALSEALTYVRPECVGDLDPAPAAPSQPTLAPGECWEPAWARVLTSPSGRYRLALNAAGALLLTRDGAPVWTTAAGVRLSNRLDGTVVLTAADGTAVWTAGTAGTGPAELRITDGGHLVLTRARDGEAVWSNGPLQVTALRAVTPAPVAGDLGTTTTDWDADGLPDLVQLHEVDGYVALRILSGASGFRSVVAEATTPQPVEDADVDLGMADWNRDGTPDLFLVKKSNTGTRQVEAHVLSGAAGFRQWLIEIGTAQPVGATMDFSVADVNGDARPDLVGVKRAATGSGKVEVHILSGADNFGRFSVQTATAQGLTDAPARYVVTDWNADGKLDVAGIKTGATGTGSVEAHILSGATAFTTFLVQTGTGLTPAAGEGADFAFADWDGTGRPDLLAVTRTGPTLAVTVLRG